MLLRARKDLVRGRGRGGGRRVGIPLGAARVVPVCAGGEVLDDAHQPGPERNAFAGRPRQGRDAGILHDVLRAIGVAQEGARESANSFRLARHRLGRPGGAGSEDRGNDANLHP